jgi:hypothetical protein
MGPQVPVTLRAVSSPLTNEVAVSQPPRIRFPSYDAPTLPPNVGNVGPVQPASFVAPTTGFAQQPVPQPGVPQTLPVTELQPASAVPGLGPTTMPTLTVAAQPADPAASTISPDGFHARGSMH